MPPVNPTDTLVLDLSADKALTSAQGGADPALFKITVDGVDVTPIDNKVGDRHYRGTNKPFSPGNNSGTRTGHDNVFRIKVPAMGGSDAHKIVITFLNEQGNGDQTTSEHLYVDNVLVNGKSIISSAVATGGPKDVSTSTGPGNDMGTNGAIGYAVEVKTDQGAAVFTSCYLRGTGIATPNGDVAVETLTIGQLITTPAGSAPIKWIGHRAYDSRFSQGNVALLPVLVRAGALADGIPSRDLYLSPNHALLLQGVLVPAETLVNGTSIVKTTEMAEVEYFHVELDQHGIVFAEGAATESFIDDNSRAVFHNAHEYAHLYPNEQRGEPVYCAPRLEDGEMVESVRSAIALRADPTATDTADFGALLGRVGSVTDGVVRGWAQHAAKPEVPVCLELLSGDVVIGRTLANRFRADLWKAGIGSGCQGFEVTVPAGADVSDLRVRRANDGAELVAIHQVESIAA